MEQIVEWYFSAATQNLFFRRGYIYILDSEETIGSTTHFYVLNSAAILIFLPKFNHKCYYKFDFLITSKRQNSKFFLLKKKNFKTPNSVEFFF